jgi:hypothetical protein
MNTGVAGNEFNDSRRRNQQLGAALVDRTGKTDEERTVTRIPTLSLALIGLAGFCQPAAAHRCLPQSGGAIHGGYFEHASRIHHRARYVVIERPRTVYEVYEPMPVAPYEGERNWRGDWAAYDDGPYWHADYYGDW